MSAKKSLFITLRIFFVLFSLQFVREAFYQWDGYSYRISFIEFLPDLSLTFIFWSILGILFALVFWLIVYWLTVILPKSLKIIHFESIMVWIFFGVIIVLIKRTLFNISIVDLIGLSYSTILLIGSVLAVFVIWLGSRYINFEKVLIGLDMRVAPLVWLFALLFVLAVPLSIYKKEVSYTSNTEYISDDANVAYSDKKRPNIILVIMDTLTAKDMQLYGYQRPTTPFISEWAKNAIVFNKTYSSSNWTTPSVMSIMTGQRPWTHRIWYRAGSTPVSKFDDNLARILKDYGYAVYGFVQNHDAHPEILGIGKAFLIKDNASTFLIPKRGWVAKLTNLFENRPIFVDWVFENNFIADRFNITFLHPAYSSLILSETVYNRFLKYIPQNLKQPFFAWIHVLPPHCLYLPPNPYMGMFGDAEEFNTGEKQINSRLLYSDYEPERQKDIDILRKRYDEFILYSDQQFKFFLSGLSKTFDLSNTIIILMSDHGEIFSHGFQGHDGPHLYEPLVNVPLIIKIPVGTVPDFGNVNRGIIDIPVEQIDIAPTILELAGIPVPEWIEGRSLLPLLEGKYLEPLPVFSMQLIRNRSGNYPITKGTVAVWDKDYKLIYYIEEKTKLLFNLRTDPDEMNNILEKEPEIGQMLLKLIEDELSKANEGILERK